MRIPRDAPVNPVCMDCGVALASLAKWLCDKCAHDSKVRK